ncbi:hypothetical protein AB6809_29920 [Paraburkholderia sp. RCC_158]|uniref:hypothetical protein n=1 Tax=Paraburkholderia sp. RCC_158 TaxID=3239220 RepID=UPI0035234B21
MSKYIIRRRFAEHSGGTKAYQIFEVQRGDTVAVVFQFGKFSPGSDPVSMGGTVHLEGVYGPSQANVIANRKQGEKNRRGYTDWDVSDFSAAGEASFLDVLQKLFGKSKAKAYYDAVSKGAVSEEPPAPGVENSNEGKAKAPAITESAPEWGTW